MSWFMRSNRRTPRVLLPCVSRRGEKAAMPTCPGSTPMRPPATPLFAGMPTEVSQSPAESYMPHVAMTLSTCRLIAESRTCSPSGVLPPAASTDAMRARSRTVTEAEHCRV